MKPTFRGIKQNHDATSTRSSTIWLNDEGCPFGTVPVRKITKDDLIRQKSMPPPENVEFDDQFIDSNNNREQKGSYTSSPYKLAIVRTVTKPDNKFWGGGMIANLHNPHVEGQQSSACRVKVHNGRDILQAGWRVDPTLYGDNQTRLFIHFQAGKTQCFNTLCPGFVHANQNIPLDMPYKDRISQPGKTVLEETFYIVEDLLDNWWLLLGENSEKIGYWPRKIFTDLTSFAMKVEWGGVVYSPPGVPEPPMGSGNYPIEDIHSDSYCKNIAIIDTKANKVEIDTAVIRLDSRLYDLIFKQFEDGANTFVYVLYGGPGRKSPLGMIRRAKSSLKNPFRNHLTLKLACEQRLRLRNSVDRGEGCSVFCEDAKMVIPQLDQTPSQKITEQTPKQFLRNTTISKDQSPILGIFRQVFKIDSIGVTIFSVPELRRAPTVSREDENGLDFGDG
ncbi:putative xyloglucan galactosyltransferase KATAMARI1-like [Capsicum annuum]|nr:putative xyloglucan galactosyltransferase KATAMARI1-like [Capsicum annuum]KAF3664224.1 putative xyloglucan galactosyltransferase KATAMARI1-like [Capsicum annuum]